MQLRVEMFNAFNHPQFNAINNSATFNTAGQITNSADCVGRQRRTVRLRRGHRNRRSAQNPTRREDLLLADCCET